MSSGRAPLATLLIISAIDLLVCCLTAGVMLFLVFQPSQRADRSSAVQSRSRPVTQATLKRTGASAAPIILIVRNRGDSPLEPHGLSSTGYQLLKASSGAVSSASDQLVLTTTAPGSPISFVPRSKAPFAARISVVHSGKIQSQDVVCSSEGGGTVTVDPAAAIPVHSLCDTIAQCEPTFALTFLPAGNAPPLRTTKFAGQCAVLDNLAHTIDQVQAVASECGLSAKFQGTFNQILCITSRLCNRVSSPMGPAPFGQFIVNFNGNICTSPNFNP
jgi:hypothetical protein